MWVAFVLSLFVPHLSSGASGGLFFVIVVFPGYLHLYFGITGYVYHPIS